MKRKRRVLKSVIAAADVGVRLQQLRRAYGWRQIHISQKTKISAPSWNKYEMGREVISVYHASLVARVTGATLDWIYFGKVSDLPPGLLQRLNDLKNGNDK